MRSRINQLLNKRYNNPKTLDLVGCDYEFLIEYIENKFTKDKIEIYIDDVEPEKQIIYDTVYVDKPIVKINNTPKNVTIVNPKTLPVTQSKKDTNNVTKSIITDTIN